jgi:hypothetical protein
MNLNNPSFFYNELTESIGSKILELLSRSIKKHGNAELWLYPTQFEKREAEVLYWSYEVFRLDTSSTSEWDIYANAGPDSSCEPTIEMSLFIKKGKWIKNHTISQPELFGVIAHEIHHIAQGYIPLSENDLGPSGHLSYFLDPREKEAFHMGFRAQSYYSNRSIESCMEDYLRPRVDLNILSKEQSEEIIRQWLCVDWCIVDNI